MLAFQHSNNIRSFIFNFVVTPRNFIIAFFIVTTKLNTIFFHHANFQGINIRSCHEAFCAWNKSQFSRLAPSFKGVENSVKKYERRAERDGLGTFASTPKFTVAFFLSRFSTWRICWREQAKSECDWAVMSSVFVASQSSCFFLCSREQIRQVENRLHGGVACKLTTTTNSRRNFCT